MPTTSASVKPWIKSSRLRLREFNLADRYRLMDMHKDPKMQALLIDPQPFDQSTYTSAFLLRMMEIYREYQGLGVWAAERMKAVLSEAEINDPTVRKMLSDEALETYSKPRPEFIGWFNLMPVPHDLEEIELGSRLLPVVWGSGLAIDGGELLLRHAFLTLNRQQVWAFSHPEHRAVQYCVHTLGFNDCGMGSYAGHTVRVYQIQKQQWEEWQQQPRKQRMRYAVNVCRQHDRINQSILKQQCGLQ